MGFLYILQSESSGRFYVGPTDDLDVAAAHGPVSLGAGRKRVAMCTARASYPHDLAKFVRKLICKEKQ
jgi:hypothetical protein